MVTWELPLCRFLSADANFPGCQQVSPAKALHFKTGQDPSLTGRVSQSLPPRTHQQIRCVGTVSSCEGKFLETEG